MEDEREEGDLAEEAALPRVYSNVLHRTLRPANLGGRISCPLSIKA